MKFVKKSFLKIYNENSDKKIFQEEFDLIQDKLLLVCEKFSLNDYNIIEIINSLLLLKEKKLLDKVNNESLSLLSKIIGFNKDDNIFFHYYFKALFIPYNLNHCEKEDNLTQFLVEFDIFINFIVENLSLEDVNILKNYNIELYEIITRCLLLVSELQNRDELKEMDFFDSLILDNTLSHTATMLYFGLDEYNHKYDLLLSLIRKIVNGFPGYLYQCSLSGIYQNGMDMIFDPENVLNEYLLCNKLLSEEFSPPIKIYKDRR